MIALDTQPDAVALANSAAIGATVFGVAVVPRVVHTVPGARAGDARDPAAERPELTLSLTRHGDTGRSSLACVSIGAVVAAADGIVLASTDLRTWRAPPDLTRSRAAARTQGPTVLIVSTLAIARSGACSSATQLVLLRRHRGDVPWLGTDASNEKTHTQQPSKASIHGTLLDSEPRRRSSSRPRPLYASAAPEITTFSG